MVEETEKESTEEIHACLYRSIFFSQRGAALVQGLETEKEEKMKIDQEYINAAKCELHMSVGETTKIKWDGNGYGRFMAVLTLIETLAKMQGVSFEQVIIALCNIHEAIEQREVEE